MTELDQTNIQHIGNGGECRIGSTVYHADGFSEDNNTVYEFYGNYWHGNPRMYNSETINQKSKKSMGDLFDKTMRREQEIRNLGFEVSSIWEDEWEVANTLASMQSRKQEGAVSEAATTLCSMKTH